jgi:putative ABC transport system substrate-binding protein
MAIKIARRKFIGTLGGTALAWPLAARAQQPEPMRRIGVLEALAADDPQAQSRNAAFLQGLQQLGWTDGRNVRIDVRWSAGNATDARKNAVELVALAPDVIFAIGCRLQLRDGSELLVYPTDRPAANGDSSSS